MSNKLTRLRSLIQRNVMRCNCCKLGDHCLAYSVFTRSRGDIPGCISAGKTPTLCEQNNVDVRVTDYAEKLAEWTDRYFNGGFTPDGIRWLPKINYEEWWRQTWNYGKLQPVK